MYYNNPLYNHKWIINLENMAMSLKRHSFNYSNLNMITIDSHLINVMPHNKETKEEKHNYLSTYILNKIW